MVRLLSARQSGASAGSSSTTGVPNGTPLSRSVRTSAVEVKTFVSDAIRKHDSAVAAGGPWVAVVRAPATDEPAAGDGTSRRLVCSSISS